MIILGIDPGYDRVGVCVLEKKNNQYKYIFSCLIETSSSLSFYERLLEVDADLQEVISLYKPDVAVIEKVFFSNNQKTALNVAESRGVICLCCYKNGIEIKDVSPSEMKLAITGDGRANKSQVKDMVFRTLKLKSSSSIIDDTIDAMGLAMMV